METIGMRKLLAVAVLATAQMGAQDAPPPKQDTPPAAKSPTPEAAPIFRSTTHLVQVNVIVRHSGKPVAELKKEDFQLFDNGKPQTVSVFSVESTAGALPT